MSAAALGLEGEGEVLVRPEQVRIDPAGPIRVQLIERTFHGPETRAVLALHDGARIEADLPPDSAAAVGDELGIWFCGDAQRRFRVEA